MEEETLEDMVKYKGWVVKKREHGKVVFLDMRLPEYSGELFQVVASKDKLGEEKFQGLSKVGQESALIVEGKVIKNGRAPTGEELALENYKVIQTPVDLYPLATKEHSPETLLEWRHLALRGQNYQKIMLIREEATKKFREFFTKDQWHEVTPPILNRAACEGGATLFEVNYFDKTKAFLSQSAQLYLEAMIYSLGKVWSLTPSFRAEKSRTPRHLAEFWHLEGEAAFYEFKDILKFEEESVSYVVQELLKNPKTKKFIADLGGNVEYLKTIKAPFEKVSYDEGVEIIQKKNRNFKWGDDPGSDEEKILFEHVKKPFFLTYYPTKVKPFYTKEEAKRPEICYSADLIVDIGELTTGGQREDDINRIVQRIKNEGFDPKDYSWYLDLRKYGSVPHAGFGLGIERFVRWVTNQHIRDTIPFPRSARQVDFI